LTLLNAFAQLFAAAMQMGPDGAEGEAEGVGDLLVGALFLMIEDEDCPFNLAQELELLFDGLLELALFELLLGVAAGVGETVFPTGGVVGERDVGAVVAAAAFPLVLGDVYGDAVEIGGDEGFAAEAGQGAVEAEEDVLSEIVDVLAAAGETHQGAEDHVLVVVHELLEGEIGVQAGLDNRVRQKFHEGE
jgi:hypothetical protein